MLRVISEVSGSKNSQFPRLPPHQTSLGCAVLFIILPTNTFNFSLWVSSDILHVHANREDSLRKEQKKKTYHIPRIQR